MSEQGDNRRLLRNVAMASAALIALTVLASQFVPDPPGMPAGARALPRMRPPPASAGELLESLGVGSVVWYACFLSAPLFVLVGRVAPIEPPHRTRGAITHLIVIVLLALITAWVQYTVSYGGSPLAPPLSAYLQVGLIGGGLPFLSVAAVIGALDARSRAQRRALEASMARSQLAESRLEALTAQLQPHFLFNTLQGISTLIRRDPEQADAMLTSLSDLLREVLRRGERREVTLSDELRVLEPYLDIARRRFGDRLTIDVRIDAECADAFVPFFLLQPLVENAFHHGIASQAGAGRVEIVARRVLDTTVISVRNDGASGGAVVTSHGIGLANVRARLDELYDGLASLHAAPAEDGSFEAIVSFPRRTGAGTDGVR